MFLAKIPKQHNKQNNISALKSPITWGSKDGALVRAPVSHQCGLGSNPGLLVLSLAPRGVSPGTSVFPFTQKPTLPNSNSIWNPIRTPKYFVGK